MHDRRQAPRPAAAGAHRAGPPSRCACCGIVDLPPEVLSLLRYGRGVDNSPFKRTGLPLPVQHRGHGRRVRPEPAARDDRRRQATRRTSSSATSRRSSATRPRWSATDQLSLMCRSTSNAAAASRSLTLDDPERRNALSQELVDEIIDRGRRRSRPTTSVGALVVTGAPPAFCSGADVSALTSLGADGRGPARRARRSTPGSCASSTARCRRSPR